QKQKQNQCQDTETEAETEPATEPAVDRPSARDPLAAHSMSRFVRLRRTAASLPWVKGFALRMRSCLRMRPPLFCFLLDICDFSWVISPCPHALSWSAQQTSRLRISHVPTKAGRGTDLSCRETARARPAVRLPRATLRRRPGVAPARRGVALRAR